MDKLKIKWRVFMLLSAFCVTLVAILWLFHTVLLTDMYKLVRTREIDKAIRLVGQSIDKPNLQDILDSLAEENEIVVTPTQEYVPPQKPLQERLNNRARQMPETITKTQVFTLSDGRVVSFTFYAIITPVEATVSTLQLQLYIVTGVMLVLSLSLAVVISKFISKPIEDVSKGAKLLGSGRYETRFEAKGFLEIKELSDTLNKAAAELSKAESLRRELLANVSHDLRTPLSLIYSYAEMMHDFPGEITSEQTQLIMDETLRLTRLVNDVLDISKLETGMEKLCVTTFDITESLKKVTDRVAELIKKDGYSIIFDFRENTKVYADEVKIVQAYYNLLINAINYTGADKTVSVRQIINDGTVRIEVADTGEGVNDDDLPYIWDRYYKVSKTHKRAVAGTGLGLSIVRKVMEHHGFKYGVSPGEKCGSIFWFETATKPRPWRALPSKPPARDIVP